MGKRVLIAASCDWTGVSRLPALLVEAGISPHLIDGGRTQASTSRWLDGKEAVRGGAAGIAKRVAQVAAEYDRVILCDEHLLRTAAELEQLFPVEILPASPEGLLELLDKTRFPSAARAAGLPVADSAVCRSMDELEEACASLDGPMILKGREGVGGNAVRLAVDLEQARVAANDLGFPLLAEEWVEGSLCLMPCLFDRGYLVAAVTAEKRVTVRRFGPSTMNVFMPVDQTMLEVAVNAGSAFDLDGLVSIDYIRSPGADGAPRVLEINPRPVPQHHMSEFSGVDMGQALASVLSGEHRGEPLLGDREGPVALFPQELTRTRLEHGYLSGSIRWAFSPRAFEDAPRNDVRLLLRQLLLGG